MPSPSSDAARPRVVITRAVPDGSDAPLRERADVWTNPHDRPLRRDELLEAVRGAHGVLSMLTDRVDAALLDAAGPQLRVVANFAVGTDNIDTDEARRRGIAVGNTPEVLTAATADHAWALLLAVARRIAEGDRWLRAGRPWTWSPTFLLGQQVSGSTLGVVGWGRIGQAVARRAAGFDMQVLHAHTSPGPGARPACVGCRPLEELLASADVVSLHAPATPATRHLLDARRLGLMKPGAILVNTARGSLVDEAELVAALRAGRPGGAGLDVFEAEPAVHPGLLELDAVVVTPHLGSATEGTRRAMADLAVRAVLAHLPGDAAS